MLSSRHDSNQSTFIFSIFSNVLFQTRLKSINVLFQTRLKLIKPLRRGRKCFSYRLMCTSSVVSISSSRFHSFSFFSSIFISVHYFITIFIFIFNAHPDRTSINPFMIFHMFNIFKCSHPDTTRINQLQIGLLRGKQMARTA